MKRKLFLIAIFHIACFQPGFTQNQRKIDSLINVVKTAKEDTNKVNLLMKICTQYLNTNPEPMLPYIEQANALSEKLNFNRGRFFSLNAFAVYYDLSNDFARAVEYSKKSIKLAEEDNNYDEMFMAYSTISSIYDDMGEFKLATPFRFKALAMAEKVGNQERIASANHNIGINYESRGNYQDALTYYFKSLKIREAINDSLRLPTSYGSIGDVYSYMKDFENGKKYHLKSLSISEKIGDVRDMISSYYRMGMISTEEKNTEDAKNYFSKCLSLCKENGDVRMSAATYQGLGQLSDSAGDYTRAMKYQSNALSIFEQTGDKMGIADATRYIGLAYLHKDDFKNALLYFQRSRAIADSIDFKASLVSVYKDLSDTYAKMHDYKRAYEYSLLHKQFADSMLNKEMVDKTTEMREKYESEKKEKEIALLNKDKEVKDAELKKQKLLKNSFIAGFALLAILSFFVFNNFRVRNKLRLQNIRNKIASDLHDDIGSTLNSISVYSEVAKQKSPTVVQELEQIGEASRKIIDAMSDIVWTINPKNDSFENIILRMRSLSYNLMKAKNIEHTFRADEDLASMKLSIEDRRNFYLIFKEAVNNLVKYSEATRASIILSRENKLVKLSVRDNGKGFDVKQFSTGNGLFNMRSRAAEMNADIKIESEPGKGTIIELTLKA